MMASKPTVQLGLLLFVARDTELHLKIYGLQTVHALHIPVAYGAIQLSPKYVGLVVELDVIRHVIDPDPWNWSFCIEVLQFLNQLRVFGYDVLVAEEAFPYLRNARVPGSFRIGMAKSAIDLLHSSMNPMTEKDGLFGTDFSFGKQVIEVEQSQDGKEGTADPQISPRQTGLSLYFVFSHLRSESRVYGIFHLVLFTILHCSHRLSE